MKVDRESCYGLTVTGWGLAFPGTDNPQHEDDQPHIFTFANGFGVYPKKEDAEFLNREHQGAYKVVPVVIAVGVPCGMANCNTVHHPDWGKGTAPRPKRGKAHSKGERK